MLTQLFQPEPNHLKGLTFARDLVKRGHGVEVITGFPNYPGGKIYDGYKQRWSVREMLDGVPVIRVSHFMDHSRSALRRIGSYVSLAVSTCVPGIFLIKKPDVVHVYLGPATLALPALILKLFFGVPYVLDVQDLWPESVLGSGMLRFRYLGKIIQFWCDLLYCYASKIVVLSPGYKTAIMRRGVPEEKIQVIYNWCDVSQESITVDDSTSDALCLSGIFSVMYAGNLGELQALESVVRAAKILLEEIPEVRFLFVGDGIDSEKLKGIVAEENIDNVRFIPRQPVECIGAILDKADVLLIHLRDDPLCRIGIPQKTQAYLAAGKPIIMAVQGDAADLLKRAGAGVTCEPEKPESIADAVRRIYNMTCLERQEMASNGRRFYVNNLSYSLGSRMLEKILIEVANG